MSGWRQSGSSDTSTCMCRNHNRRVCLVRGSCDWERVGVVCRLGLAGARPWMTGQAPATFRTAHCTPPNEEVPTCGLGEVTQLRAIVSEPQAAAERTGDRFAGAGSLHVSAPVCLAAQAEAFQERMSKGWNSRRVPENHPGS